MASGNFTNVTGSQNEIVLKQKSSSNGLVPEKHDFNVADFSGGINNRDADTLVADNQLTDAQNVIANDVGSLEKRYGYLKMLNANLNEPIVSMFEFNKYDGTQIFLFSTPTKLYKYDSATKAGVVIAMPAGVTLTSGVKTYFVMQDVCYFLTGTDYLKYDGTTVTAVAYTPTTDENTNYGGNVLDGPKKCTRVVLHKSRVFLTGDTSQPNRVYFSHPSNPSYFPANNIINFYTEKGDVITGISAFAETVIITKSASIGYLDTTYVDVLQWSFKRLNVHTGASSGNAVVPISNYLVYPSSDGFYALTDINSVGALATVAISALIPKTIKKYNTVDWKSAVATYYKGRYVCHVKNGDTLVFDYLNDSKPWWFWTNIPAKQFLVRGDDLWFCTADGQLYKFQEDCFRDGAIPNPAYNPADPTDVDLPYTNGVAITAYAFTKNFDCGFPSSLKQFKKFRLLLKNYEFTNIAGSTKDFTVLIDWLEVRHDTVNASISFWGVAKWGDKFTPYAKGELVPLRIPKRGRTFMFGFRNEQLDQPFCIFELIGKFKEKAI
jgi:hypothetical protein